MKAFEDHIINLIKKETKQKVVLKRPPDPEMGDFALACFQLSKHLKKDPKKIAGDLCKKIKLDKFIEKIEVKGPYLNFFVHKAQLADMTASEIFKKKNKFGSSDIGKNKRIVVEYPGPNTNKPLHIGHLRNMALGPCLASLFEFQGHKVFRVNINNDRGVHICKSMLAYQKWGKGKTPESEKRKSDHFVGDYYVLYSKKAEKNKHLEAEIQDMLRKWEAKDKAVRALWKKMNKWAFDGFNETYKHFGLPNFDKEYYESITYEGGKKIVLDGLKKRVFKKTEDGAVIIDLKKEGFGEKVVLRADGTSVYVTQDMNTAQLRYKDFKFDRCIYVVATEQNHHFNVLFTILKKLGFKWASGCYHFAYGMVHLPEGKMKSREGKVVDADDLMLEMEELARKEIAKRHKDLAEQELHERSTIIALGAIKFYLLKIDAAKDMVFHPKESLSFEGDTGPYVQYTHARACSILRKAKEQKLDLDVKAKFDLIKEDAEIALVHKLAEFPNIAQDACVSYKPHFIAQYLLKLSRTFNEFYHSCHCLNEKNKDLAKLRLLLIYCTKIVIKNGLALLGITAPERM